MFPLSLQYTSSVTGPLLTEGLTIKISMTTYILSILLFVMGLILVTQYFGCGYIRLKGGTLLYGNQALTVALGVFTVGVSGLILTFRQGRR
jgi:hypothetical protein